MKRSLIFLFAAVVFLPALLYAGGEKTPEKKFIAGISAGYHGYSTNDYKGRVAEYETTDSSPDFKLFVKGGTQNFDLDITGRYKDSNDNAAGGAFDFSRILRIEVKYNQFIHRLDHDEFYAPYVKKSQTLGNPQFMIPVGINNDPSDPQPDSFVFKKYPAYDSIAAWETHGPKAFRYTDLNVGKDYIYNIERFGSNFKIQVPSFPNLIVHGGYNYKNKTGYRQVMTMSHCASCHVVSQSQRVDQTTQVWKAGGTLKAGILTLDFTHKSKRFRRDDAGVLNFYEMTHHPPAWDPQYGGNAFPPPGGEEGTFGNRLNYQYTTLPFARVPETDKDTETFKARVDLSKETHITGLYVYSKASDKDRTEALYKDLDQTTQSAMGRITSRPIKKLTLTAGLKYYTVDADDIYVRDAGGALNPSNSLLPNPGSFWGYDGYINANPSQNFGYNRKSAADRDVTEFDTSANYNFNNYVTARIEYRFKDINRKNGLQYWENEAALSGSYRDITLDNSDDLIHPVPADYHLNEYGYGDPTIHTIDGTIYFYPKSNLSGRFGVSFEYDNDPFEYPHAKGERPMTLQSALSPNFCFDPVAGKYPNTTSPTCHPPGCVCVHGASSLDIGNSSNYADFFVPLNRIQEGTNQPSHTYKTELSLNWSPSATTSISPVLSYSYQDNDDTPWKSQKFNAGISAWWAPHPKLNFVLSYNFYHEKTTTDYWFTYFNG